MEKKTPCKKPCKKEDNDHTFRIVWDHEISEKIFQLEAKILSATIIVLVNILLGIGTITAILFKK